MRADNYSLSEETKRLRDQEQREITDQAYAEALQLVTAHRHHLDVLATALLEKETLERDEIDLLLKDLEPTSNASGQIGVELPRDGAAVNGAPAKATPAANGTPTGGTHRREPVLHSSTPERDPKTPSST
jgi:cell division protease FtsH